MPDRRFFLRLLAVAALLSAAVAFTKFITPMPAYFEDAVEWAKQGRIADTFTPLGYPLFLGPAYRLAGTEGIVALQALLEIAIAALCYLLLRELRVPAGWAAYGSLPVIVYPDLLFSVTKVWDVAISTFLFLAVSLCCLRIANQARGSPLTLIASSASVFAAAVFCRPNLVLLLPVVLILLIRYRGMVSAAELVGKMGLFMAVSTAAFCWFGIASHGSAFFPHNGGYNLYAGNNRYSSGALWRNLNAEPSLFVSLSEADPALLRSDLHAPAMNGYFNRQAIGFIRHHPGEELKLVLLKFFTLFRPDTKVHRLGSLLGLAKAVAALPAVLFLAALLLRGRPSLWPQDWLLFSIELLYIVPFLLTNSDPRFRGPLDALILLHLVSLAYRRFALRHSAAAGMSA